MKNTLHFINKPLIENVLKKERISLQLYYCRIEPIFVLYFKHEYRQNKKKKYA